MTLWMFAVVVAVVAVAIAALSRSAADPRGRVSGEWLRAQRAGGRSFTMSVARLAREEE